MILVGPVLLALRRRGGQADVIRDPCAADGLPDVADVDTTRREATA